MLETATGCRTRCPSRAADCPPCGAPHAGLHRFLLWKTRTTSTATLALRSPWPSWWSISSTGSTICSSKFLCLFNHSGVFLPPHSRSSTSCHSLDSNCDHLSLLLPDLKQKYYFYFFLPLLPKKKKEQLWVIAHEITTEI